MSDTQPGPMDVARHPASPAFDLPAFGGETVSAPPMIGDHLPEVAAPQPNVTDQVAAHGPIVGSVGQGNPDHIAGDLHADGAFVRHDGIVDTDPKNEEDVPALDETGHLAGTVPPRKP